MAKSTKESENETKAKKPVAKKAAPKKETATKKAPAKKPAAKKETATKKTPAQESAPKKADPKKETVKKEVATKAAPKKVEEAKSHTDTFTSDNISLTVTKHPQCAIEMAVHAKKPLIEKARQKALKSLAKDVTIPGFRKGKAPTSMLLKRFPQAVDEQIFKELADLAYRESQMLAHCPLLNGNSQISYDLLNRDLEKGVDMSFTFESEPSIPEIDYSIIDLKGTKLEKVDDKKINETIDQIRSFYATSDVVKDRAAKEKDFVLLDIDDLESTPPVTVFKSARFEVKEDGMAEWMLELVKGMKPGDSKEATSRANSNDSDKIKEQFKPKKVKVTLVEIQEMKLPEINDELATKVGVATVDEMRSQLKKMLEKQAQENFDEDRRERVSKALLEKVVFDIPKSVKEKEFSHRFNHSLKNEKFKKEWDTKSRAEQEEFQKEIMDESDRAIKLFYLSRELVRRHDIAIAKPKEQAPPTSVLEAMFTDRDMMHFDTKTEEEQAYLMSKLLLKKAQDFCVIEAEKLK
ncbi:MAG: trigger factor [Rhabdochlamydiaceae bacterium]|nr:trigger factor [Candidatus Amphrikana amoebophyrae]